MKLDAALASLMPYGIDFKSKAFYLCGEVNEETPDNAFLAINALRAYCDDDRPIKMYLTTPGGCVESGLAVFGFLKSLPETLEVHVLGYAYSMGIILVQAGDIRTIDRHASLMAHWGHQAIEDNNPVNYEMKQKFQRKLDDTCDGILLQALKRKKKSWTLNKVKKATQFDWYMSAEEALKHGLVDCID